MSKNNQKKQQAVKQENQEPTVEQEAPEVNAAPTVTGPTAEEIAIVEEQDREEAAEAKAKQEAEEKAKKEADAKAKQEAEEKAKEAKKSRNILTDSKVSVAKKVEWCLTEATGKVRVIANTLESYNKVMKPGVPVDEKKMVRKQYELVNLYRDVFSVEDYGTFKELFNVINLFFNHYAKESLGEHYLYRFDYLWQWDQTELTTLLNVNEVISQLANYESREVRLKQLNLEYALNPDETIISNIARDNIIRYYSV